jgi:putative restriction endonuclease
MRGYVGVTDGDWYRFLADRPQDLGEVNFWRPGGGRGFHAVAEGEPFFFKTHAPDNRVVGGGFFGGFAPLRVSEAWDLLGTGNGVASQEAMMRRIAHYRREPIAPGEDPEIGCVLPSSGSPSQSSGCTS